MITSDFNRIEELTALVIADMQSRHPDCSYTVRVLLWDDETLLVECRHAHNSEQGIIICNSVYNKDELKYTEHLLDYAKIKIDGRGNEYKIK